MTLPILVTAVFLALDFRMQIELNIETEQIVFQVSEVSSGQPHIGQLIYAFQIYRTTLTTRMKWRVLKTKQRMKVTMKNMTLKAKMAMY